MHPENAPSLITDNNAIYVAGSVSCLAMFFFSSLLSYLFVQFRQTYQKLTQNVKKLILNFKIKK